MRVFTRLLWLALSFVAVLLIGASSVMYATVIPKKPISTGKDYYIVFPHAAYGDQNVEALVNSPVKQKIHIQAAGSAGGGGYKNIPVNQYQDIETGIFHIERNSEIMDVKGAARITTASPVSVIGQFGTTGISGTYNALPVTAWGTDYIVLDEPEGTNSGYQGYYPGVYSIPQVTIIASQPGTTVLVTLPPSVRTALDKTGTFSITFNNAGDVYYFSDGADPAAINRVENTCLSPSGDFTGTHIVSTDPKKPIGVIVSQSHTSEPCGDNECGDFGMEWLPPICNWDTAYIITASVPHGGTDPGQGELLRVTFAYDNTTLYTEDANGKSSMGTFNAGDPLFIGNPIIDPYVLSADQPFLVCEITTKPQSCLVGNRGGGANFTFSMVFLTGVTQWSDYVPFGTADLAASSQANIYFRQADEHRLYFNGVPLLLVSPVVNKIPGTPYAYLATPLGSNTYYEMRGDSGAAAGGSIFGYGQSQVSSNNGNKNDHTLNPEMVKSFAHPIGVNALPSCSPDTTPPHVAIHYNCGYWFPDTAWDDELVPPATGMYDIYLAENTSAPGASFPPDSSYNVQWSPAPSFTLGTNLGVQFGVQVNNLADTAVAALHFRDGAGNEYDTILVYFPPKLIVTPTSIDVGALRQGTTANASITLTDSGNAPTIFTTLRLAIGKYWKIVNNPPITLPLKILPDSSFTVQLQYTAPISATYECDPDTLIVNTCRQFPIATMIGCTKKPAINSSDYDFQCWTIDTLGLGGDTVYSLQNKYGVYVASIGSDTMHVTAATLAALNPAAPYDPTVDFAIMGYYDKVKKANISLPDTLPPGDTMFVIVRGHPHQSGTITAQILYTDDANHYLRDTSVLTICGLVPGIVTHSVDFGTHLYATAKDSFVVVKNSGQVPITIERLSPFGPDSAYFNAYPYGKGYTDPTTKVVIQYPDTFLVVGPSGAAGDSARYPFRFYAWKLGANLDSVTVANTSPTTPDIALTALVVQPHVWGQGSCPNDSVFVGSTGTQTFVIGNQGTDVLNIDSLIIGGVNASEWGGITIVKKSDGSNVPWPPPPYTPMAPGDTWVVTLTFTPNHVGPSNGIVHVAGFDALNRHSNDSIAATTPYAWGKFPYDTNLTICNNAFSQGVKAISKDVGMIYIGTTKIDSIAVVDTGKGDIIITDVNTDSADQSWILGAIAHNWTFPDTLHPNDTLWLVFTFAPVNNTGGGLRHYSVTYNVINSTGDTVHPTAGGTAVEVDIYTHIDRTWITQPGGIVTVPVVVDSIKDPIGQDNVFGYTMEMTYYNRSVAMLNKAYNVDLSQSPPSGVGLPGEDGRTMSVGATVTDNIQDDTSSANGHDVGSSGYYELIVKGTTNQIDNPITGPLLFLQFTGLKGPASTELTYDIPNTVQDKNGNTLGYVVTHSSPGLITVDSVCGLNLTLISYNKPGSLAQNSPNPVNQTTDIVFSVPGDGHAVLTVTNSIGQVVATPVDQDLRSGQYNVTFDASSLPTGLYYYTLQTADGYSMHRQMMVVR